jgi:hypothetical protein
MIYSIQRLFIRYGAAGLCKFTHLLFGRLIHTVILALARACCGAC